MTKADLIAHMADAAGITKRAAGDALDALLGGISKCLSKGDSCTLTGFGTFKVSHRAARMGINPQTGEKISIKARKVPTFKAGKGLKEAVA